VKRSQLSSDALEPRLFGDETEYVAARRGEISAVLAGFELLLGRIGFFLAQAMNLNFAGSALQ
jgi:hypothetical protein